MCPLNRALAPNRQRWNLKHKTGADHPTGTVLECPKCKSKIKLGSSGSYNLQQHVFSSMSRRQPEHPPKKDGTLRLLVQKNYISSLQSAYDSKTFTHQKYQNSWLVYCRRLQFLSKPPYLHLHLLCPFESFVNLLWVHVLACARNSTKYRPRNQKRQTSDSRTLALFAVSPESCVAGEPEDEWENGLNAMFHQAFGWGGDMPTTSLIQRGRYGIPPLRWWIRALRVAYALDILLERWAQYLPLLNRIFVGQVIVISHARIQLSVVSIDSRASFLDLRHGFGSIIASQGHNLNRDLIYILTNTVAEQAQAGVWANTSRWKQEVSYIIADSDRKGICRQTRREKFG